MSVRDIPLERIRESTTDLRWVCDETKLREFENNIQLRGVLQAILVRLAPEVSAVAEDRQVAYYLWRGVEQPGSSSGS